MTDGQGDLADGMGLILCAVRNLTDGGAGLVRCSGHLSCAVVDGTEGLPQGIQGAVDVALEALQITCGIAVHALGQVARSHRGHHGVDIADHAVQGLQSRGGLIQAFAEFTAGGADVDVMVKLAMQKGLGQSVETGHGLLDAVQRIVDGPFHLAQVTLQIAFDALCQFTVSQMLNNPVDLCNGGLLGLQQGVEGASGGTHFIVLSHLNACAVVKILGHILCGFLHLAQRIDHRTDDAHGKQNTSQCATTQQHNADQLRVFVLLT